MKRTIQNIAILFAIPTVLFVSCIEEPTISTTEPTITITEPVTDTTAVMIGDSVIFSLDLTSETDLVSLQTVSSGLGITFANGQQTYSATMEESVAVTAKVNTDATVDEVIAINFTVANATKQTSATKYIKVLANITPLSEATDFIWKRVGGAAAEGLEMFGLTWTSNTGTSAVIKKGATKFVELDAADWTNISDLEALKTAIDAGTDMEKWEAVSSQASKAYDLTLGTIKDDIYYLIHIVNGTVTTETAGTTITITGQYKK